MVFLGLSLGNGLIAQSLDYAKDDVSSFETSEDINVQIYPNPTSDFVRVSVDKKFIGNYKLSNIFGKNLLEGEINDASEQIDLLKFRTGIYIIRLYDVHGNKVATRKIIKN